MSDREESDDLHDGGKIAVIAKLRMERDQIKDTLNRFSGFLDRFTDEKIENLELRLKSIEGVLLRDFTASQNALRLLDPKESNTKEHSEFEDLYFECTGRAVKIIRAFYDNKVLPGQTVPQNMANQNATSVSSSGLSSVKGLPKIELIKFSGDYDKWAQFRDLYKVLIHDDRSIDKVRKFYYLLSSLQGDASKILESLEITEKNYDIAWNLLVERFEDKNLTIKNHVKALFELPTVSKDKYPLRNMLDDFQKRYRALKLLNEPVESWSTLLIHLLVTKLDSRTVSLWEEFVIAQKIVPKLDNLLNFLSDRCKFFETSELQLKRSDKKDQKTQQRDQPQHSRDNRKQAYVFNNDKNYLQCKFCKGKHHIYRCEKILELPVESRIEEIKKLKLCLNCLRTNHSYSDCVAQGCRICSKRHNTIIHSDEVAQEHKLKNQTANVSINNHTMNDSEILLSTATVMIQNHDGKWHHCRALLDSGSQSNFMTKNLAEKLKLKLCTTNIPVIGIGDSSKNICHQVTTKLKSHNNKFNTDASFLLLNKITEKLPSQTFSKSMLKLPDNITLADEHFNLSKSVDLLLGVTIFYQALYPEQRQMGNNMPILQNTCFGWILSGPLPMFEPNSKPNRKINCHFSMLNIENQLQKFWQIEEYPNQKFLSKQEIECETIFKETLDRDSDGHFIVKLPIKQNHEPLGDSLEAAVRRLKSIERKFTKNPEFKLRYTEFMREYEQLGHMSKIKSENVYIENTGKNLFYLPHHGVINETSTTTSLRVVFDGSCPTSTGVSLNNILLVGPTIQDELISILIRFRQHAIVITADVAKMYRQIKVSKDQQDLQRIVWRENSKSEISHYQLKTVTYGTAAASFLATRALQQAAIESKDMYPNASSTILSDFYVDDLISGTNTLNDAIKLKSEITAILEPYGFHLRKWVSNCPEALGCVENDDKYYVTNGEAKRTLGLVWQARDDILTYSAKDHIKNGKITKRIILSTTASIFDPLGLLAPIVIRAKILMQAIWQSKEGWDSPLPTDVNNAWLKLVNDLQFIDEIKINRHALIKNAKYMEIHSFSDASQSAYGCCIYLRSIDENNICFTQLLCAKSRVAPLKTISIPRLELCSAVLAVKLYQLVKGSLKIKINKTYFWTDSMIVLGWLSLSPSVLKIFVANRVADIQNFSDISQWRHVPTGDNPADLISRGTSVDNLKKSSLWWSGPQWLNNLDTTCWPNTRDMPETIPEVKNKSKTSLLTINENNIFTRYSSLFKLLRVTAYCFRFYKYCKKKTKQNSDLLTTTEIDRSMHILIKIAQSEMFPMELNCFNTSQEIPKKSKLLSLNPIMGPDGLLRVGGRISKSSLPYDTKHQIILLSKHPFTRLIVLNEHHKNLHAGILSILYSLREKFWIIQGRRAIRSILKNCVTCFRINPKRIIQKMGNLPFNRVNQQRPFYITGVDFAGPFLIKDGKLRNRSVIKAYLCIFICFTTKAAHLEAVGDLSSDAFLDAVKRFVSRRGLCHTIYSDNGTNFVGANNELKAIIKSIPEFVKDPSISDFLLKNAINWSFIPPRAPHHGGLWECAVKRAKYHIIRVIGKNHLTFERLSTLFTQVEAAMNSVPLTPLSEDPSDLSCLTPGHFLIGTPLLALPQSNLTDFPTNRLSHFKALQQMFQEFWKRWSRDYLLNLQERIKWKSASADTLKIGSLVLVVDENLPPLYWRLGRILLLHPGQDGLHRVATLQTSSGSITRAVQKLCLLPNDNE